MASGLNQEKMRSWLGKFRFKSEVSHSSQYPRAAVLWIVEDAEGIADHITSASTTGKPFQEFENLGFKLRNKSPQPKVKLNWRGGQLQADRLLGGSSTSPKTRGDNEAILDLRYLPKVQ